MRYLLPLLLFFIACSESSEQTETAYTVDWEQINGKWDMVSMVSLTKNAEVAKTVDYFHFKDDLTFDTYSSYTGKSEGNWSLQGDKMLIVQYGNPVQVNVLHLTATDLIWEMKLGTETLKCMLKRAG